MKTKTLFYRRKEAIEGKTDQLSDEKEGRMCSMNGFLNARRSPFAGYQKGGR